MAKYNDMTLEDTQNNPCYFKKRKERCSRQTLQATANVQDQREASKQGIDKGQAGIHSDVV